jgi:predicted nucleic acid-binding protein
VIVADTGAIVALLDADDRHHRILRALFEERPAAWVLPWAILPEVDYLALAHLGSRVEQALLDDLVMGSYLVDWGKEGDLPRARDICRQYRDLGLGLVDGVVMAIAERRRTEAIATLDLRHFAAVRIAGDPKLYPRDLSVPRRDRRYRASPPRRPSR